MKKKLLVLPALLLSLGLIASCNNASTSGTSSAQTTVKAETDAFTDGDLEEVSVSDASATITLNGNSASTTATSGVSISNNKVTITAGGTYAVSGSLTDGTIIVEVSDSEKVTLILNGATITSSDYAGIYVKAADKVFLVLNDTNTVKNTGTFSQNKYDSNNVDGVIFSKVDLTIKGSGTLNVESKDNGIVCKDDLKVTNGTVNVTSSGHAIEANNSVRVAEGKLTLNANQDGIHVEHTDTTKGYFYGEGGNLTITSLTDGIDASGYIKITGGDYTLNTGKSGSSESMKGLKADGEILLGEVEADIISQDDALHSATNITINNADLTISTGDDALHADNEIVVNGGEIEITKSHEGLEAVGINIKDGTINVVADDDGFNAAGGKDTQENTSLGGWKQDNFNSSGTQSLKIEGGTIVVDSKGDGLDSNGSMSISGGNITVYGPTDNGNASIDYDGSATITGGVLCAFGSSGMAQNMSGGTQCSALITSSGSANTKFTVSGNGVNYSYTVKKSFGCVVFSAPDLEKGSTYTFTIGSDSQNVTFSSYLYGSSSGMGGNMSGPGGRR